MKMTMRLLALCLAVGALVGFSGETASATGTHEQKVTYCHATGDGKYVKITTSGAVFYEGHREHESDIYEAGELTLNNHTFPYDAQGDTSLLAYDDCAIPEPTDYCPNLDGDQPKDTQCYALFPESQYRDVGEVVTCETRSVRYTRQGRVRSQVLVNGRWDWPEWGEWINLWTSVRPATEAECPIVTPTPVEHTTEYGVETDVRYLSEGGTCRTPQVALITQERRRAWRKDDGVIAYGSWTEWSTVHTTYPRSQAVKPCVKKRVPRVTVIDKCRCAKDKVTVFGEGIASKVVRQNKFTFTIRLVAKPGYLLPVDYKHANKHNGKAWAHSVTYVVHTTNTKCPCPPGKKCAPVQHKPIQPCARRCV